MMAKRCFMADVEKLKTWGVLPYLHDASTLKGVSK